jgi:hypothetical protein
VAVLQLAGYNCSRTELVAQQQQQQQQQQQVKNENNECDSSKHDSNFNEEGDNDWTLVSSSSSSPS